MAWFPLLIYNETLGLLAIVGIEVSRTLTGVTGTARHGRGRDDGIIGRRWWRIRNDSRRGLVIGERWWRPGNMVDGWDSFGRRRWANEDTRGSQHGMGTCADAL